jgi:hypothetical protein
VVADCDWATHYTRTLAKLTWGVGGDDGATLNPAVPWAYVGDIVRNEHMHLQHVREFGSIGFAAFVLGADRIEITAECPSMLTGALPPLCRPRRWLLASGPRRLPYPRPHGVSRIVRAMLLRAGDECSLTQDRAD